MNVKLSPKGDAAAGTAFWPKHESYNMIDSYSTFSEYLTQNYWVGQKDCSGFSVKLWWKNPNKLLTILLYCGLL